MQIDQTAVAADDGLPRAAVRSRGDPFLSGGARRASDGGAGVWHVGSERRAATVLIGLRQVHHWRQMHCGERIYDSPGCKATQVLGGVSGPLGLDNHGWPSEWSLN